MAQIVRMTGRAQILTGLNNGDLFLLGNVSNESDVGGWVVTLMPDQGGFDGGVFIMRRPEGMAADNNNVGFMPSPYRRITVSNVASDGSIASDALTGATEVLIPAYGTSIALSVYCNSGSAVVYTRPLQGTVSW